MSNIDNPAIGLDISDNYIKAVQLKKQHKKIKLGAVGKLPLDVGIVKNGSIINEGALAKSIVSMINKPIFGEFAGNNLNLSLPEGQSFIKLIQIEKSPNNLVDIIEGEIEKNIPFSLNEIYYDWQELAGDNNVHKVILAAAPQKIIEQYLNFFDSLSMEVRALETESTAICRALLAEERASISDEARNYAILELGSNNSTIIFYTKGVIAFSLGASYSGNDITEKISRVLEVTPLQAEKAKIILGFDPENAKGIVASIAQENVDILLARVKHALLFYEENFSNNGAIEKIILSGGGAYTKGLDAMITAAINIPVERGNSMSDIEIKSDDLTKIFSEAYKLDTEFFGKKNKENVEKSDLFSLRQESSLSFSTAIGLSLRDFYID